MKLIVRCVGMLILVGLLVGCQDQEKRKAELKKETIITAKLHSPVLRLYYSGILSPITLSSILSPVEGHVTKLDFSYGSLVEKGQPVVVIDSASLTEKFRKAITDFLQNKSKLGQSKENFMGSKALYLAGAISKESYLTEEIQHQTDQINFFQSQFSLEQILMLTGIDPASIERLTLADKKQIIVYLKKQFKHIVVKSVASGIALFPVSGKNGGSGGKRLDIGVGVKQNQLLLSIGDLSGLSSRIQVSEVNINRIRKGMPAIITSTGFPGITLNGYVAAVSAQAKATEGAAGTSSFMVKINIPKIAAKYKKIIHIGMTSKIEIDIKKQPVIMVPIAAVFRKNGGAGVTIIGKSGERRVVSVVTSFTTPTQVAIVSGVKDGDRVVVPKAVPKSSGAQND